MDWLQHESWNSNACLAAAAATAAGCAEPESARHVEAKTGHGQDVLLGGLIHRPTCCGRDVGHKVFFDMSTPDTAAAVASSCRSWFITYPGRRPPYIALAGGVCSETVRQALCAAIRAACAVNNRRRRNVAARVGQLLRNPVSAAAFVQSLVDCRPSTRLCLACRGVFLHICWVHECHVPS